MAYYYVPLEQIKRGKDLNKKEMIMLGSLAILTLLLGVLPNLLINYTNATLLDILK